MKNLSLLILFLCLVATAVGQTNTFPASGNAGVGTTSPEEKLHIYRNTASYFNPLLVIEDDIAGGYTQMSFKGTGKTYHIGVGGGSESAFSVANKLFVYDVSNNAMRWTLDATGNTGFGTTTPGNRVSIFASAANASGLQLSRLSNASPAVTGNGKVLSVDASGNVILVDDQQGSGSATAWSYNGNSGTTPATNFLGTTDAQDLVFKTSNSERFRVKSGGNFLIGTSTDNGKKLQVSGSSHFDGTVGIGSINTSDANYKLFVETGIRTRKVKVDADAWPDYVFSSKYQLMSLEDVERYIEQNSHLPEVPSAAEVEKNGIELGENQAVLLKKIEELTLYVIEQNKEIQQLKKDIQELRK